MHVAGTSLLLSPPPDLLQQHPGLLRAACALEQAYAAGQLVTDELLEQIGSDLWQVLEQDEGLQEALSRAGNQVLPIMINSNDAAIQHLPWEILYHQEQGFLGRESHFTLSRSLADLTDTGNGRAEVVPLETGPLRVLLFTALPDDLDAHRRRLDVEEEQARVLEALLPRIAEGPLKLRP